MKIQIEINIDNAAFEDCEGEIVRIIKERLLPQVWAVCCGQKVNLRDTNGNKVGFAVITEMNYHA